jgi:hypothetical protein
VVATHQINRGISLSETNEITKLKARNKSDIVEIGCAAHIMHNCAQSSFGALSIVIETLVVKTSIFTSSQ